jgi:hypothetical protein
MVLSAFVSARALFHWRFHCEKLLKPFLLKAFDIYQQQMNKQQETQSAWDALMSLNKRHYVSTGFYALGDAYLISGKDPKYKNIIVLVEHQQKTQINHWEYQCNKSECSQQPTIETNGDDGKGNLKRKAPSLKVYS